MDVKVCYGCGAEKPLSEFNNNKAKTDGKQDQCKLCQSVGGIQYKERNKDRSWASIPTPKTKCCSLCGKVKNSSEFWKSKSEKNGLKSRCKECDRERQYKYNARTRGVSWELTKEEFLGLCNSVCHYCGEPPNPFNGVDRYDNEEGYTVNNCVPCCKKCNFTKRTVHGEIYIKQIKKQYNHLFGNNDLRQLVGECIEEIESRDMDNWGYVEIYAKKLLPKLKQAVEEG